MWWAKCGPVRPLPSVTCTVRGGPNMARNSLAKRGMYSVGQAWPLRALPSVACEVWSSVAGCYWIDCIVCIYEENGKIKSGKTVFFIHYFGN